MKRNITVQLDEATVQKARVAAAKRGSSISRLLTEQIDLLARQDDDYDRAMQDALAGLGRRIRLIQPNRDFPDIRDRRRARAGWQVPSTELLLEERQDR